MVPDEDTAAKSQVCTRFGYPNFVDEVPHDLFGVVGFVPPAFFYQGPLTEHKIKPPKAAD